MLQRRERHSHVNLIKELEPEEFRNYLRMSQTLYNNLLHLVTPKLEKQDTVMRKAISVDERLKVTLRYLATGRSYTDLQYSAIISKQALSSIIPETCKAIYEVLKEKYMKVRM